ncbi:hypothetical protein ABZY45_14355 [Streptomyces sp. NPDC006516]|uniref:hypothetical protein n=1 Tax=Streptomyces sp. NPDC006516 TaxID=3154309 RepID=UPI00339E1266
MAVQPDDEQEVRVVVETVDSLEAVDDPAERARRAGQLLAAWPAQGARLGEIRQTAVMALGAQDPPVSYRKIATALGISLARVQQIEAGERGRKASPAE